MASSRIFLALTPDLLNSEVCIGFVWISQALIVGETGLEAYLTPSKVRIVLCRYFLDKFRCPFDLLLEGRLLVALIDLAHRQFWLV